MTYQIGVYNRGTYETRFIKGGQYKDLATAKKALAKYLKERHTDMGHIISDKNNNWVHVGYVEITTLNVAVFVGPNGKASIIR